VADGGTGNSAVGTALGMAVTSTSTPTPTSTTTPAVASAGVIASAVRCVWTAPNMAAPVSPPMEM